MCMESMIVCVNEHVVYVCMVGTNVNDRATRINHAYGVHAVSDHIMCEHDMVNGGIRSLIHGSR